ncbi:hypothetical protein K2173_003500 [Erythroxylum novogranatense]|uniref:O-fucosyltransferase family protein n=1 Tax=Erythroxylum novogranatense TaxID=1862640 RepID=A0AAV8TBY9_9ROSI|nr:hypothetical protein K2173_003500 [Erythroxylum novogranatense]
MDVCFNSKQRNFYGRNWNSFLCRCFWLLIVILLLRVLLFPSFSTSGGTDIPLLLDSDYGVRRKMFLEVPQIVWGLNNQKISFARACLTARMLNRTLLMPSLSASLFYKETDRLQWISFDQVFQFERFNSLCNGFVQLGRYSYLRNQTGVCELHKGRGRKWTPERDFEQLRQFSRVPFDVYEVIRIVGKNPFLWHDHWSVKDYAKVFECLVFVNDIAVEADKVVSKIREAGRKMRSSSNMSSLHPVPYLAVHMRIEKDWMIHCKKLEQISKINEICTSKQEIMKRVGNIVGLRKPTVVYVAVAHNLLQDSISSILHGWGQGLIPLEKRRLGVENIYRKYPYLIQSAIDYQVCSWADVFVGNSFSTFSNLVALERTQKMIRKGVTSSCGQDVRWPSYAYNILGESNAPRKWMTNMTASTLQAFSFGTNIISCSSL